MPAHDPTTRPPALGDVARAATITATVTSARGRDAARVSGTASLCHLRQALEALDFEHRGVQPVKFHTSGRYRPLWREVWSKSEAEQEEHVSSTWSLRAQKNHQRTVTRLKRQHEDQQIMQAGPRLAGDGHTLIVPSRWYQLEAAAFWKAHGFRFHRAGRQWTRDTRRPYNGKRYAASAWLESTRREFYRFWPQLLKACVRCGEQFAPVSAYQVTCADCEKGETDA